MGNFENIIFEKNLDKDLTFEYKAKLNLNRDIEQMSMFRFIFRELFFNRHQKDKSEFCIYYKITFTTIKENITKGYVKPTLIKEFVFSVESLIQNENILPGASIKIKLKDREHYSIKWENISTIRASTQKISQSDFKKLQSFLPDTQQGSELKNIMNIVFNLNTNFSNVFNIITSYRKNNKVIKGNTSKVLEEIKKLEPITIGYSYAKTMLIQAIKKINELIDFETLTYKISFLTGEANAKINFKNLSPIFDFSSEELHRSIPIEIINISYNLRHILVNIFSSYTYIGPLREEPSRRYIYEDEVIEVGIKGENAAYIYHY